MEDTVGLALQPSLSSVLRASDEAVRGSEVAEVGPLGVGAGAAVGSVRSTGLVEVAGLAVNGESNSRRLGGDVAGNTIVAGRASEELVVGILQKERASDGSGAGGNGRRRSLGAASAGGLDSAGGGASCSRVTTLSTEEHAVPPVVDTESTLVKVALVDDLGRGSRDGSGGGADTSRDRLSNSRAANGDSLVGDTVQYGGSLNSRGSSQLVKVELLRSRGSGCKTGKGSSRDESCGGAHSDRLMELVEKVVKLVVDCSVENVLG